MELQKLKDDCAIKQKKGLHFILASVVIWCVLLVVHLLDLHIVTKNFITFCCATPLMPLAFFISKIIKVDFQNKNNPLSNLGILFSINQIIYILIVMWVYSAVPEKMLMVFAMVFGAHLMPFGWLYSSKTYIVLSVVIPILSLIVGLNFAPFVLAIMMIIIEIVFCFCLAYENKKLQQILGANTPKAQPNSYQ